MHSIVVVFMKALSTAGLLILITNLLMFGLIFLTDAFLLLLLSTYTGGFMAVSYNAIASLLGALLVGSSFRKYSTRALRKVHDGIYPEREFIHLSSLFISLVTVTILGLFSLIVGLLLYLPPIRNYIGEIIHRKFKKEFNEVYSYRQMTEN